MRRSRKQSCFAQHFVRNESGKAFAGGPWRNFSHLRAGTAALSELHGPGPRRLTYLAWRDATCRPSSDRGRSAWPPRPVARAESASPTRRPLRSARPQGPGRRTLGVLRVISKIIERHFCHSRLIKEVASSPGVKGARYKLHILMGRMSKYIFTSTRCRVVC